MRFLRIGHLLKSEASLHAVSFFFALLVLEKFFLFMRENNIDSRPFFYPISSLPMFEKKPGNKVAYDIFERGINLPSHHELTRQDIEYVSTTVKRFLDEN